MKAWGLVSLTAAALSGAAHAAELYNNGPVVGDYGKSVLLAPAGTLGFNMQIAARNALADDFTVTGNGWLVSSLDFFSFQNTATSFTLQNVSWSILAGDANNGTVLASGTTALSNGGFVGYRVAAAAQASATRRIFRASADISDVSLSVGHYWLRWSLSGSVNSGPWQPPTADARIGNALQSAAGGTFSSLVDATSRQTVELPFVINGTLVSAVPEPSAWLLMLAGGVGLALRRRR